MQVWKVLKVRNQYQVVGTSHSQVENGECTSVQREHQAAVPQRKRNGIP